MKIYCRACLCSTKKKFTGQLLDFLVDYYECEMCGYVQTEEPHWLGRAYEKAINDSDTGIMVRNQVNARIVLGALWALRKLDGTATDFAGGYGILVRLLRDFGINAYWSDRYCQNHLAQGFEHTGEITDLVTAFEAFEHFINPGEELDKLLGIAPNVLFSTVIIPVPTPKHDNWWYYGHEHGQHIGFFRIRTLEKLARDRGKYFVSDGSSYHLMTDQPVNQAVWKIIVRRNKIIPALLGCRLTSKTWSDHELVANKRQ